MLMQELGRIIQEDPNLCAMAMVDKRKYIISKWNANHSEPIDEDAVALFLCDENCGNLTEEQRAFAKERCAEFEFCNQVTAFRLLQCGEMMRQHLVSGPAEYFRIFQPQCAIPSAEESPFAAACEALCALLRGRAESLPHLGLSRRIWPDFGQGSGTEAAGDEEQEKTLALLCARAVTSARSAGGFGDLELALFRPAGFGIGAVLVKKRLNPRRCGISGGADEKRRRFWR